MNTTSKSTHEIFNDSYERILLEENDFFATFYQHFFAASEHIRYAFRNTDMDLQIEMLKDSFYYLMSFRVDKDASSFLHKLAKKHSDMPEVKKVMFDIWVTCLLEAVKEHDPQYKGDVEQAWRNMLEPGLEYMKDFEQ